ncbi:MAG: DEAD/DEAH box helicase [Promethearchaeota archaeon]
MKFIIPPKNTTENPKKKLFESVKVQKPSKIPLESYNWQNIPFHLEVVNYLKKRSIRELYPPQIAALSPGLQRHNLLISIPTASGKTLIAELIALNLLMRNREKFPNQMGNWGKILYLAPLKALAIEKYHEFSTLWNPLGFHVGISRSDVDEPDFRIFQNHLIILTNEKADSFFRMNPKFLKDIDLVIVDEIHLLRDQHRGITLEVLLTRLLTRTPPIQIIGLSATILNSHELAQWLHADLISSTWRPVQLKEGYYIGDSIFFQDGSTRRVIPLPGHSTTATLTLDTLKEGGQVIVFVNSRKNSMQEAEKLAPKVRIFSSAEEKEIYKAVQVEFDKNHLDDSQLSHRLSHCLKGGVAFHHAGMASDQLDFIVKKFNSRRIKVIFCTPTLAAGVNTPARRVIIKTLYRYEAEKGSVLIPILEYKQMAGRAGRPGYDPYGEVVILGSNPEKLIKDAVAYILGTSEEIHSQLTNEESLGFHILGLFLAGVVSTPAQLIHFVNHTFYAFQQFFPKATQKSRNKGPNANNSIANNSNANKLNGIDAKIDSSNGLGMKTHKLRPKSHRKEGRGADPLGLNSEFDTTFRSAEEILEYSENSNHSDNSNLLLDHSGYPRPKSFSPDSLSNNYISDTSLLPYSPPSNSSSPQTLDKNSALHNLVLSQLTFLWKNDFLTGYFDPSAQDLNSPLIPTKFGEIVGQSYLNPQDAVLLREDLIYAKTLHANNEIILHPVSWLHLLTKLSVFPKYFIQSREYSPILDFIDRYSDHFIMEQVWDSHDPQFPEFAKEIKMTMLLFDWINEIPQHEINEKYNIGMGDIRRVVDTALWILRGFLRIVKLDADNNYPIEGLGNNLQVLNIRIKYGIRSSLVPFVQISGIGRIRARKIYQAGYKSIEDLKKASLEDLSRIPLIGKHLAQEIYSQLHLQETLLKSGNKTPKYKLNKKISSQFSNHKNNHSNLDDFLKESKKKRRKL